MLRGTNATVSRELAPATFSDVVIIGAGAAGLTAAYDLKREGMTVQILEASERNGGRLKKNDALADFPLDVGGEWIHVDPEVLNLIADYDVTSGLDIAEYSPNPLFEYNENTEQFTDYTYNWADYKFVGYTWFDFFNDYIAGFLDEEEEINLGCKVTVVNSKRANTVKVKCEDGRVFKANDVILAVPITVLKESDILFKPKLPKNKRNNFPKVAMPPGIKIFLKFSEKFYPSGFNYANDNNVDLDERFFYDAGLYQPTSDNILGVFAVGPPALDYVNKDNDAAIIDQVLMELDDMFDGEASLTYTGNSVVQNWSKEPYIRGSYSGYFQGYRALRKLAKPVANGRIFFAGEYVPVDWEHGFAHGAAISGKAAAYQILNGVKSSWFLCDLFDGTDC